MPLGKLIDPSEPQLSHMEVKIMAIYPEKKDMLVIANVNAISSYVTSQLSLTELCLTE